MKRIYKVGNEYFEKKTEAKAYRNKLEGYTPVLDKKTGKYPDHKWKMKLNVGQIIGKE